jgi:hypothetical protein
MDPAFRQMAGGLAHANAGAGGDGPATPAVDPAAYMQAMQGMMSNPEFMHMAERLGTQMMQARAACAGWRAGLRGAAGAASALALHTLAPRIADASHARVSRSLARCACVGAQDPAVSGMLSQMNNPAYSSMMQSKMAELKNDPELASIMKEIESGGPQAMMKYWNDPNVLAKLGKAMGGDAGLAALGGGGALGALGAPGGAGGADDDDADEDEDEEEEEGELTLHSAASTGDHEALAVLLAAPGCEVNAKDEEGRTALHFACGYGEIACAEALLAAKANADATDKNSNTALHYAAGYGRRDVVQLLVDAGASVVLKNADGKSPIDVARLNNQAEVLQALEKDVFL